jgi:hypothetical protein
MDYEALWYDEIVEQWVSDFVINERQYFEVSVSITDPDANADEFNIKNVVFTIEVDDQSIDLWVFYNVETKEIADCESLHQQDIDVEKLAEEIFLINERWKEVKYIED